MSHKVEPSGNALPCGTLFSGWKEFKNEVGETFRAQTVGDGIRLYRLDQDQDCFVEAAFLYLAGEEATIDAIYQAFLAITKKAG